VRAHLLSLERDGLARQSGTKPGFRKPHAIYALTPEAEQIFPKSYGVLLDLILIVISRQLSPKELRAAMREVGRRVADNHLLAVQGKSRKQRIEAALRILKDLGGSATFEQSEGKHFICGNGCPLAAATSRHPEACLIAESLLSHIIGVPVKEHCIHGTTPSCRFEIRRSTEDR
jgi:predicted ArsR family transcriptional regulator